MFKCKACEAKDKEIDFLRAMLRDAQNRIMAFTEKSLENYSYAKEETPSNVLYPSVLGRIESMEAETEEDKKNKEDAKKQFMDIIGH